MLPEACRRDEACAGAGYAPEEQAARERLRLVAAGTAAGGLVSLQVTALIGLQQEELMIRQFIPRVQAFCESVRFCRWYVWGVAGQGGGA